MNIKDYSENHFVNFYKNSSQIDVDDIKQLFGAHSGRLPLSIMRRSMEKIGGELIISPKGLCLRVPSNKASSLIHGELLLLVVELRGKQLCCQVNFEKARVLNGGAFTDICFLPVKKYRVHRRIEMSAPTIVSRISSKLKDQILFGSHHIRRVSGRMNKPSHNYVICEDCIFDRKNKHAKPPFYKESPILASRMIGLSQGGCKLILTGGAKSVFEGSVREDSLLYIQTSLNWGKIESSIRVLAQIRGVNIYQHKVILHCAFMDSLPRIPDNIKFVHYDFYFRLNQPATLRVNSRDYFKVNESLNIKLPLGIHDFCIRWKHGGMTHHRVDLRKKIQRVINLESNIS